MTIKPDVVMRIHNDGGVRVKRCGKSAPPSQ